MSRPSPEELRRRLTERLAAEAPRGNTMSVSGAPVVSAAPTAEASPTSPAAPKRAAVSVPKPTERLAPTAPPPSTSPKAPLATKQPNRQRSVVRRNDESGRLRSHPVDEDLYLAVAKTKLRASRGRRLTWDEIIQTGLDIVLSRPGQLESLLTEVDSFRSRARRTIAATVTVDHDIAMQELLLENRTLGEVRDRLKLEDLWCAALIAWRRTIK